MNSGDTCAPEVCCAGHRTPPLYNEGNYADGSFGWDFSSKLVNLLSKFLRNAFVGRKIILSACDSFCKH